VGKFRAESTNGAFVLIHKARAFFERTAPLRENRSTSYVFGLATIALALLVRLLLARQLVAFPFLTLFPAIILTGFICGWRAAAVASIFGAFAARYLFADNQPFPLRLAVTSNWVGYALYFFAVAVILVLVGIMHLAFRDFSVSEQQRKDLNAELESRVRERTAELEDANQRLRDEAISLAAAEETIRQMQKMEAVGQLTGGIAHDFNNMLAIIIGSLDIAKRQLHKDSTKAERFIVNAVEGAQRGAQLTSRLLAFSRQQPLRPRSLDTNGLIRDMSELLKRSLGETIELDTVLAEDLWRTFSDGSQLESAVINLCVNSRDAMPDGGVLTVETTNVELDDRYVAENSDARAGAYVCVAVTDTGSGMTAAVLARAFDPFYTTKATGQGTGLGLSQVYGFVKQSGGHIRIYSEIDKGTTVRIYLPRFFGPDEVAAAPQSRSALTEDINQEVILVVEDEDRVRSMTVEALRGLGYEVIAAAGPQQALDGLSSNTPLNLLFTDVVMPGMNGRVLADRVKIMRPSVKVLYTTGYTRDAVIHNGMLDRDVAFLAKPFTIDQLALKVRETLDAIDSGIVKAPT
jgi:signal transduction histidine kinase/ActR/RegA family two-component response regulator